MSLYPQLDELDLSQLWACFEAEPIHGDSYADLYYEEVAYLVACQGPAGVALLVDALARCEGPRLRGALLALGCTGEEGGPLEPVLAGYLGHREPRTVAAAISALGFLPAPGVQGAVVALAEHDDPHVRAAVLRYLNAVDRGAAREHLRAALGDPHPLVRQNAVDELVEAGTREALEAIRPLRFDAHLDVRRAAASAVASLERSLR
jgi:hypothetical protein